MFKHSSTWMKNFFQIKEYSNRRTDKIRAGVAGRREAARRSQEELVWLHKQQEELVIGRLHEQQLGRDGGGGA